MPGLTDEGFVARRQPELLDRILATLEAQDALQGLNVRAGPIHQLASVLSEEVALLWEGLEAVYGSQYDGATGISLDQVAALTGTLRDAATRSRVALACTLDAGTTVPAGSVVAVDGSPDAQFRTLVEIANGGATSAVVDVQAEAVETGPVAAPTGTLTVIVTSVPGWTAVTNAADAELGAPIASDSALRTERRRQLAAAGSGTTAAIAARLSLLEEVIEAAVYENVTASVDGAGRPAKTIEAVVWDGSPAAADDDAIAQVLWNHRGGGIPPYGSGESGTAVDALTGQEVSVDFSRATLVPGHLEATVLLVPGADPTGWIDAAKESIAERGQQYAVGEDPYASQLSCVLLARPEVQAVVSLVIGTTPVPASSTIAIGERQVVRFDTSDMTLGT